MSNLYVNTINPQSGTQVSVVGNVSASVNVSASAFYGDGANITGVTGEWDGSHTGNATIAGSLSASLGMSASAFHAPDVTMFPTSYLPPNVVRINVEKTGSLQLDSPIVDVWQNWFGATYGIPSDSNYMSGSALNVTNAAATGSAVHNLVSLKNFQATATGETLLNVINMASPSAADGLSPAATVAFQTIGSNDTNALLDLRNLANDNRGPNVNFGMYRMFGGGPGQANDELGTINFGGNNAAPAPTEFAKIEVQSPTVTAGQESGKMSFNVRSHGTERTMMEIIGTAYRPELRVNPASVDASCFIHTSAGEMLIAYSTGIGIGVIPENCRLHVSGSTGVSDKVLAVDSGFLTTDFLISGTCDTITTGGLLKLQSNSASPNPRPLVVIHNRHASAVAAMPLWVLQDAEQSGDIGVACATFETSVAGQNEASTVLLLNSDGDANGPVLEFANYDDTNANTNNDVLGAISFTGNTDHATPDDRYIGFADLVVTCNDITVTDEGATFKFRAMTNDGAAGAHDLASMMELKGGLASANAGVVFNEDSVDHDFRIESNGLTHMLFVDGGNDKIGIAEDSPDNTLHVKNASGVTSAVVKLEQLDVDEPFILFTGTTAADQTKSLSTDTSVGALTGHIRVEINGTDYWVPYYATN